MENINQECSICLLKITNNTLTKCNHNFCNTCLLEWTKRHPTCPLCRTRIKNNILQSQYINNLNNLFFNNLFFNNLNNERYIRDNKNNIN